MNGLHAPSPSAGLAAASKGAHDDPKLRRVADDFESVFVSSFLRSMLEDASTEGPLDFSDGFGSMLGDEYGKVIARSGGIGISDAVYRELISLQESRVERA